MRCSGKAVGLIVLVLLSLAGCTAREGARVPTGATIVPTENALVLPPPGGPEVLNVVERRFGNAVEQDVNLHTSASTPGQNYLRATFFGPTGAGLDQKTAAYSAVRASEMMREAGRAIPGVPLTQSPYFLQNNYGPFGYAFGRRGSDACLYAWQQIRPPESQRSPLRSYGTIQVRLRHCATDATENELLSIVYGYTISGTIIGDPSWNPYGAPPAVDAGLGRTGSPIYRTEVQSDQAPALERPRRAIVTAPVRATTAVEKPEVTRQPVVAPLPLPQPGGSLQSPPGSGAAGTVVVPPPTCAPEAGTACP
ncbi:cellulose biosynthesis protein BcsN [Sinorhizobium americanum]|uniref:Cellulose biosynthesis protein BcsN n=1 Tax=Sinorhizobium americanum TaxID=194963 RepID=A0A4R2C3B0_9HYPH|nr:cellulose biosynthesis protein BcsN [Sinorhizobium americanum]TCN33039.1 cellulose biosynthesis protein BcsN [Sinorhizobium americanum]